MSGDWSSGPGDHFGEHRHDYDKVLTAKSGSITFRLSEHDGSVELRAGDQLDLPAGTLHEADVGTSGVTCSETHLTRGSLTEVRLHAAPTGASETAVRRGT